jgi:lactobin A/cerein 7B family class IIb bacteriocin
MNEMRVLSDAEMVQVEGGVAPLVIALAGLKIDGIDDC